MKSELHVQLYALRVAPHNADSESISHMPVWTKSFSEKGNLKASGVSNMNLATIYKSNLKYTGEESIFRA